MSIPLQIVDTKTLTTKYVVKFGDKLSAMRKIRRSNPFRNSEGQPVN